MMMHFETVSDGEQAWTEGISIVHNTIHDFGFDVLFSAGTSYDKLVETGIAEFRSIALMFCGEVKAFKPYAQKVVHKALMEKYRSCVVQQTLDDFMAVEKRNDITRLVTDNINLIHSVIHRHNFETSLKYCMDYDDLFQIGSMALLRAAETYNGELARFSTYAYKAIRNSLLDECRRYNKEHRKVIISWDSNNRYETMPAASDIVDQFNISEKHIMRLISEAKGRYSGVTLKGIEALMLRANWVPCSRDSGNLWHKL